MGCDGKCGRKKGEKCKIGTHKHKNALWTNKNKELIFTDQNCKNHVVCVDCPKENAITGWWVDTIKGTYTNTEVLWHIFYSVPTEKCSEPILMAHLYAGYQGRYREWTPEDFAFTSVLEFPFSFIGIFAPTTNEFPLIEEIPNMRWLINTISKDDPQYLSTDQLTRRLSISKTDPDILYLYTPDIEQFFITNYDHTLRLRRLSAAPIIESYDEPVGLTKVNDPQEILRNIFNNYMLIGNPQTANDYKGDDYPGYSAFLGRLNELLTNGVSYIHTVKDVWRTRLDRPTGLIVPISTTFVTNESSYPRIGSRLVIEGFTSEYSILNGNHKMGLFDNNNGRPRSEVYGSEYFVGSQEKWMLNAVDLNSSMLPEYNATIHAANGPVTLSVIVDPVTITAKYSTLIAAVHDLLSFAGRTTHTLAFGYRDSVTRKVYETFGELQAGLLNRRARVFSTRSRGIGGTRLLNPYIDAYAGIGTGALPFSVNDPTIINLNDVMWESPISLDVSYNIDVLNYLDPDRTFNIYWSLTGEPIPNEPVTTEKLLTASDNYYKNAGSDFIFQSASFYESAPDPSIWTLYGDAGNGFDYRNKLIFGIVNPSLTCGETVAYIYFLNFDVFDPGYAASLYTQFSLEGQKSMTPHAKAFANMLKTLKQFNPTSYILNIRRNSGGIRSIPAVLASFFGNKRPLTKQSYSFADMGNRPSLKEQEVADDSYFINVERNIIGAEETLNDIFAVQFPESMVQTPGTKLIILDNSEAGSAADDGPHWFRNPEGSDPGDMGNGVRSIIIGDIDGRIVGTTSIQQALFTNVDSILKNSGGEARSAVTLFQESGVQKIRNGSNPYIFSNQNPVIKPDILLNLDIEATLWLDVGVKGIYPLHPLDGGNDPLVLPLSTGKTQPIYDDNTTWRDRSLEACIVTAVGDCYNINQSKNINKSPHKNILKNSKKVNLENLLEKRDLEKYNMNSL